MTETPGSPEAVASAPPDPAALAEDAAKKRDRTTDVLQQMLQRMELQGRVEVKDGPDGGIAVALHLEGEIPQAQGRRSNFVDALQFLANKMVNRPGGSRRWISIGVGAFPEPRQPPGARPPPQAATPSAPSAPAVPQAAAPPHQPRSQNGRPPHQMVAPAQARPAAPASASAPAVDREVQESSMEVPEDPAISAAGKSLAERSAALGRFYAIAPMKLEDRARFFKATRGVAGVKVSVEGDGRARRVVLTPEKPTPMPSRTLPVHDDEA